MKPLFTLLTGMAIAMSTAAHADVAGGIDFPQNLGGFELRSVMNNESSNPGMGDTLLYSAPGVKASVYVYDHLDPRIPEGIDSPTVMGEFSQARGAVRLTKPDAEVIQPQGKLLVDGIPLLHSSFLYEESRPGGRELVISHMFLTGKHGKFIKARITYSATDRPELGRQTAWLFVAALGEHLAKPIH